MRLIDGDELIEHKFKNPISYNAFVGLVKRQETANVTEVTPCHACAFGKQLTADGSVWCNKHGQVWPRNGFCSWGARNGDVHE